MLHDPALGLYWTDLDVVTGDFSEAQASNRGKGLVVLVRPDGHVAARGRPGRMDKITGYLRELFGEPAGQPASSRKYTSVRRLAGSSSQSP